MTTEAASTAIQKQASREIRVVQDDGEFTNLLDTARFEHMQRVASMFASSTIIPEHYRGNVGNCFIALQMATRLRVDPFMFMQNTYVVYGRPGMEAKLVIALINSSGIFTDSLEFEVEGDNPKGHSYRVRAFAIRKTTGQRVEGPWVDWEMVEAEGWLAKQGSKWKTIPGLMFQYRAAALFGRVACPERLMGMQTAEELEDVGPKGRFIESTAQPTNSRLASILPEIENTKIAGESEAVPEKPAEPAAPADVPPVMTEAPIYAPRRTGGRPGPKEGKKEEKKEEKKEAPAPTPAPTAAQHFSGYQSPLPAGVKPIDWLALSLGEVFSEYTALSTEMRDLHWAHVTPEVQAKINTSLAKAEKAVEEQDAAAEASQVPPKGTDEAQEFVDAKSVDQLKGWMLKMTDDLRRVGREAAGVSNMTEATEAQVRQAAYAMRVAQGKALK